MKLLPLVLLTALAGCGTYQQTSDDMQNSAQERANLQAVQSVGMPAIDNFWEKRQLKLIMEKRDNAFPTISYIEDRFGKLHKLCDSVGYGIPGATQFTNPSKIDYQYSHGGSLIDGVVPQADPNGLYSPSSANSTWVMCLSKNKTMEATYIEDNVDVFPADVVPDNVVK